MLKAKIKLDEVEYLIPITEDLFTKYRIMNELASMSLEVNPMLNPSKKELESLPYIYWDKEDFNNKTHTEIQLVLAEKEKEFEDLFQIEIVKVLNLNLKEGFNIYFADSYICNDEDDYVISYDAELCEFNREEYFDDVIYDILN